MIDYPNYDEELSVVKKQLMQIMLKLKMSLMQNKF